MVETEFQAPKFVALTAWALTDDGDIALQFSTEDDELHSIEIAKSIIGAVVASVVGLLNKTNLATLVTTRRKSDALATLPVTALRPMLTAQGEPGLAMVLADGLEFGIRMKRDAIPALKNALDQLEDLTSPASGELKH